jgi:muramoyltetrapeptide carboxypeptidase LdcA involved in peptidoglycan recycling
LPFGHEQPNLVWPVGVRAALDGDGGELRLLEAGVVKG